MFAENLKKLRLKMSEAQIDVTLITSSANVRYFSGFTGSSGMLLVLKDMLYLLTDFRYVEQAKQESPLFNVIEAPGEKAAEFLCAVCNDNQFISLWFEEEQMSFKTYRHIADLLKQTELIQSNGSISNIRMIKNSDEIAYMRKAAAISDDCYSYMLRIIKPGMTEKYIANEIEFYLRREHDVKLAFDIIVAAGENASLPHAQPSDRAITDKDPVTLDFGAVVNGYRSDMTRTILMSNAEPEIHKIYQIVLEAQLKALDAIKPGLTGKDIDFIAREHIAQNGYGKFFGHGLGHGVGLNIHEGPRLSEKGGDILEAGMVVTVEPGIYLPGVGGVRIEDMVLVTHDGIDNLTASPKITYI